LDSDYWLNIDILFLNVERPSDVTSRLIGKASDRDNNWPDYMDHQKPNLNNRCFVI
jgi:hypothetical protein